MSKRSWEQMTARDLGILYPFLRSIEELLDLNPDLRTIRMGSKSYTREQILKQTSGNSTSKLQAKRGNPIKDTPTAKSLINIKSGPANRAQKNIRKAPPKRATAKQVTPPKKTQKQATPPNPRKRPPPKKRQPIDNYQPRTRNRTSNDEEIKTEECVIDSFVFSLVEVAQMLDIDPAAFNEDPEQLCSPFSTTLDLLETTSEQKEKLIQSVQQLTSESCSNF